MKFLKAFFSDDNSVNEDTVMGVFFALCAVPAGFIPAVPVYVFATFVGACMAFFGKKLSTDILSLKKTDSTM